MTDTLVSDLFDFFGLFMENYVPGQMMDAAEIITIFYDLLNLSEGTRIEQITYPAHGRCAVLERPLYRGDTLAGLPLRLPVMAGKSAVTLTDCLEQTLASIVFARCDTCGRNVQLKTNVYLEVPNALTLSLARFAEAGKKQMTPISLATSFDYARFMRPGAQVTVLNLVSVVVHIGTKLSRGHFKEYSATNESTGRVWREKNDEAVQVVTEKHVLSQAKGAVLLRYEPPQLGAGRSLRSAGAGAGAGGASVRA